MIVTLKSLSPNEKKQIEKCLYHHLFRSELWKTSTTIGLTWSHDFEWNTKPIIERGWSEKKEICLPKCKPYTKEMEFYLINREEDIRRGYANLMEPDPSATQKVSKKKIDLLIIPGIVFNLEGYRIGFGGGYYDRFLQNFDQKTVSLLSTLQLSMEYDCVEDHDIPVQYVITEDGCKDLVNSSLF